MSQKKTLINGTVSDEVLGYVHTTCTVHTYCHVKHHPKNLKHKPYGHPDLPDWLRFPRVEQAKMT